LRRCVSVALFLIACAGCSHARSQPVTPKSEQVAPAPKPIAPFKQATNVSPEEDAIVSPAVKAFEPVIVALETYHKEHGRYPAALGEPVSDSLLAKAPELPPVTVVFESGLEYRSSPLPDFFVVIFHYRVRIDKGTYGNIDDYRCIYFSDDRRGWIKPADPIVSMGDLIADRLAPLWRQKHDPEILRRFVFEAVKTADCDWLLQKNLVGWLGPGSESAAR
jgi:hypothetical protein